jgi:hypothetical protein
MFERLKFFISAIGLAWQYGDTIRTLTTAWSSFPGADDSEALRAWIRPLLREATLLATVTPTPIDDMIVKAAVRLVDNNNTWTMIHALVLLGRDAGWVNGVRIPQAEQENTTRQAVDTILAEIPESPTVILAAVGVLVSILQLRKNR